jgi:hypothetical protein
MRDLARELGAVLNHLGEPVRGDANDATSGAARDGPTHADDAADDLVFDTVGSLPAPALDQFRAASSRAPHAPAPVTDDEDLEFDIGGAPPDTISAQGELMLDSVRPLPQLGTTPGSLRPLSSLPPQLQQALRGELPDELGAAPDEHRNLELSRPAPRISARATGSTPAVAERSLPPPVPRPPTPSRTPNRPATPRRGAARAPSSGLPRLTPRTSQPLISARPVPPPPPARSGAPSLPALPTPPPAQRASPPPAVNRAVPDRSQPALAASSPPDASSLAATPPTIALSLPAERTPPRKVEAPRALALELRSAALLAAWAAAFAWLAPLYYARDFGALDALLGFGRLWGLCFVGLTAALIVKLLRIARAERDRPFLVLWSALGALDACAAVLSVAALEDGPLPPLVVLIARLGMSWGAMLFLIALAIAATRRIFVARRDSLAVTGLLALLTLECVGGTAWLITRSNRIDDGQSTQQAYAFDD